MCRGGGYIGNSVPSSRFCFNPKTSLKIKILKANKTQHTEGGTFLVVQWLRICLSMQGAWVGSLDQEDPLEKGRATHSSILSWIIPWTEEPGRLHGVAKNQTKLCDFHFSSVIFFKKF